MHFIPRRELPPPSGEQHRQYSEFSDQIGRDPTEAIPKRTRNVSPPPRAAVLRFLDARKKHLKKHGVSSTESLIPCWWKGGFKFSTSPRSSAPSRP